MAQIGQQVRGPLIVRRIGVGQSNLTFWVSDASTQWVLRRPPVGELVQSAHDVAREFRIMAALGPTAVPVPRMLGLCEEPAVCQAPLVLEEYRAGAAVETMDDVDQLSVAARAVIGAAMPVMLATIHAVDLQSNGLHSLASTSSYAERQLRRWMRQWEAVSTRESPLLEEVVRRLRDRVPVQHETVLVHGDFHLRNLLVDPATGAIDAVVDWELSTLGDPLADVGTLLTYWPQAGDPPLPLFDATRAEGFPRHDELLATYSKSSGRAVDDVPFWHALGLWKVSVIAEGIIRRAVDNPANVSAIGPPTIAEVDSLLAHALSQLP